MLENKDCQKFMNIIIMKIISTNVELASFLKNSPDGWVPTEVAELMSESRLDWQVELSKTLKLWNLKSLNDGKLILAWANLGALIEGTLKLLLVVYYIDYQQDSDRWKNRKGETLDPDGLALEKLKQFFKKKDILTKEEIEYIQLVQQRRNAIHAFKNRPIGTSEEYRSCVSRYYDLLLHIESRLPYP